MCRVCGRMIKCIFESMPSRISVSPRRTISTVCRTQSGTHAPKHSAATRSRLQIPSFSPKSESFALPTTNLPLRSRLHQVSATQQATSSSVSNDDTLPPSLLTSTQEISTQSSSTDVLTRKPIHTKPLVLSKSLQSLLPALCAQQPHYITTHIYRFPYLVQTGDTLRLPFHMKGVLPGDVLRFNRASVLGSRDFTLKAGTSSTETYDRKRTGEPNYLDERLFEVRARVTGVESGPMFMREKTKRRNRRVKTVKSKHRYTTLKIMEVRIKSLEELMKEKGTILLES